MTIEQAIDEVEIAGPAAPGANGERAGEVRFGTRGKRGDLFVANMDPFNPVLPAHRIGYAVQAIADDTVDAFYAGRCERLD
jgi:hypothetical protein